VLDRSLCNAERPEPECHLSYFRFTLRDFVSSVVLMLALSPARSFAQTPVITANARLVVIDVVMTDAAGRPVTDLSAQDFKVYEDGRPQRIVSVEPPETHRLRGLASGAPPTFSLDHPAAFGRSPVTVLVWDQLNTHFADSSFARRAVKEYLERQPSTLTAPASLLTVGDGQTKQLAGFTLDRDTLLRALAAAKPDYPWRLENDGKTGYGPIERLDRSLRALEQIAQNDARIPGRKNVIWIGGGFPSMDPGALEARDLEEIQHTLRHVTNVLVNRRVTLYAVDPTSTAAAMTEVIDATQLAFLQAGADSVSGGADPFGAGDDFDRMGLVTGGAVLRGQNDVAAQMTSIIDRAASFYTIAYIPDSTDNSSSRFRRIRVESMRSGTRAETVAGYFAGSTSATESAADAAYDLTNAAESPDLLHGLRMTARRDPSSAAYIVSVAAPDLHWTPEPEGGAAAKVYVLAATVDRQGKMLSETTRAMTAHARPGAHLTDADHAADFMVKPPDTSKAQTVRFVVRDSATGRTGSFDLPVR
jgi:VWFA-related protein